MFPLQTKRKERGAAGTGGLARKAPYMRHQAFFKPLFICDGIHDVPIPFNVSIPRVNVSHYGHIVQTHAGKASDHGT